MPSVDAVADGRYDGEARTQHDETPHNAATEHGCRARSRQTMYGTAVVRQDMRNSGWRREDEYDRWTHVISEGRE